MSVKEPDRESEKEPEKGFDEITPIEIELAQVNSERDGLDLKSTGSKKPGSEDVASENFSGAFTGNSSASGSQSLEWYQKRSTVISLVGCFFLALFVIFVLPEIVARIDRPAVDNASVPVEVIPKNKVIAESPFQQAQLAKARRDSQDVLDKLLAAQSYLEDRGVDEWGQPDFQQALAIASEGDLDYRQQNFEQAIVKYQQAFEALDQLEKSMPQRLQLALAEGEKYLEVGDGVLAQQAFALALKLDAQSKPAQLGAARSASLDKVIRELDKGDKALQEQQLDDAIQFYQNALALDSSNLLAVDKLADAKAELKQRQFLTAMSQGYDALDQKNAQAAANAFKQALALNPNDGAAINALKQANNKLASQWLSSALRKASNYEQQEQWHAAVQQYQDILKRDSSIIDARVGELRSQARATLDDRITKFVSAPDRLSSAAVLSSAKKTLVDAKGIANPGTKLSDQIGQLSDIVGRAAAPRNVVFYSDNKTAVTIFKVGELGLFANKTLRLKPGQYVALGTRQGYRDVRVEFDVVASAGEISPVNVICQELI